MLVGRVAGAQTRALTNDDYARAEKFLAYNVNPLVRHVPAQPTWINDDRFWYRTTTENGTEFFVVDATTGTRTPAFDQAKLAATLSSAAGSNYSAYRLPFNAFVFSADGKSIAFNAGDRRWTCDVAGAKCEGARRPTGQPPSVTSPDGKSAAFIRDYNLWVRDVASGKEKQLTKDGVKDYGYATDNAGWVHSNRPILLWSPDSKKIATFQQDERGTGEMYLWSTGVGHPTLEAWKYPLAGDQKIFTIERVVIDVDRARVTRFQMPADPHRSSYCDDVECDGPWADVEWSADSKQVAFLSTSRDHKTENLRIADADSGKVRDILAEKMSTYYESGNDASNWRVLPASNEVIWFSERDNWGHLYVYDLQTGRQKNQITNGEGNVTRLLRVDEKNRLIYFLGVGKEKGDPYFVHYYRIGFDGKNQALLSPEDAMHAIIPSPTGRHFIDVYSTPDTPQISTVRDGDGKTVATFERADISRLLASGWQPPTRITVKARDGVTDLYGLLYKPTNFNASAKYPIVNHVYPGPQTGSVGPRTFVAARQDSQALAELGFIVVEIDGMGTPWRSKKFHDAYFGDMGDNTLPDQVAALKELAARYPWVDLDRAGVYGHSGGGYAAAGAMFHYPDFFKVGISESGNHDNRNYEDDWAEKWQGLLEKKADGTTNYDTQANQNFAKNLKGKLLLMHGTMDDNVPPSNTLLVVDALIKANKDFDLLMLPNRRHGYGLEPYVVRRRWDYFVKNLMGAEPPANYEMHAPN